MRKTPKHVGALDFWQQAERCAVEFDELGRRQTSNPLVQLAALDLAREALLKAGGASFERDYLKATRGRAQLSTIGAQFGVVRIGVDRAEPLSGGRSS